MNRVEEIKISIKEEKKEVLKLEKGIQDCLRNITGSTVAINNCYGLIKLSQDRLKELKRNFFNLTGKNPEEIK